MFKLIKQKYFTYQPGEFLPVYYGTYWANRRAFHAYRIKWIMDHRRAAIYQFTHFAG